MVRCVGFALHARSPKGLAFRVSQWLSDDQSAYQSIDGVV